MGFRRIGWLVLVAGVALAPGANAAAPRHTTFVSERYGYSLALPGPASRWAVSFATSNWTSRTLDGIGAPDLDSFVDQKSGRAYLLAARRSESLERWTAFVASAHPSPPCGKVRVLPGSTLGGARARVHKLSCSDGYRVFVATTVHAHRGYMLLVASPTALSRASDVRTFDAARRSFRFLEK